MPERERRRRCCEAISGSRRRGPEPISQVVAIHTPTDADAVGTEKDVIDYEITHS